MSDPGETFDVAPLGNGRFLITGGDGTHQVAMAVRADRGTWVFLRGRTFLVPDEAPASRSAARDDDAALAAPMPATVVKIDVEPGASVVPGQVLVVLEAMKMELPIKAPREGRIRRILCRVGELVQPGLPLLDFEPLAREQAPEER